MSDTLPAEIRLADLADAALVSRFAIDSFVDTYAESNTAEDLQTYINTSLSEDAFKDALTNPNVQTLIAQTANGICGYAQLSSMREPDCDVGDSAVELARLYVAPAQKGSGLVDVLMNNVNATARELGAKRLWLGVWERNPRAIRYYEKAGFRKAGTIGFLFGKSPQTDWVMVRPLRDA